MFIDVIFSPEWFFKYDVLINFLCATTLFLIAFFAYEFSGYSTSEKNYKKFSLALTLVGISFTLKSVLNSSLYYQTAQTTIYGFIVFNGVHIWSSDSLLYMGFILYWFLTLYGLYYLLSIYDLIQRNWITTYLIVSTTLLSAYLRVIFHLTTVVFLSILTLYYYRVYQERKYVGAQLLTITFSTLAVGHFIYIFQSLPLLYVIGSVIQLAGFILLFSSILLVFHHGKKQVAHRSHYRHS